MRIVLLQPPIQDFYDTAVRLQPLGLCALKAVVREKLPDVEVTVRDYHQGHGREEISLPADLSYLEEYYSYPDSSPFSAFHRYYHFGAPFERIGREVAEVKPDLIGISSPFSPYHREAVACAREIKKRWDRPVLMGGAHVSASPLTVLKDPHVDFIIPGEGERPLVELIRSMCSEGSWEHVAGLGYKKGGNLRLNPPVENYDLDEIPFPDFSDLSPDRYRLSKKPLCFLATSRGCPHRCSFCSVHATFTGGFRRRSPEKVFLEMERRYEEGYRVIDFEDDNLTFHKADFTTLLRRIIRRWRPGELRLTAMNGVSYHSLDREVLGLMKRAGFRDLNLSLVSGSVESLERVSRPHTLHQFLKTVQDAHEVGLGVVSYQIIGLPFETLDQMVETMSLLARLPVLIGASIFYLTPGCPISTEYPLQTETDHFKARSTAMAIETPNFNRDDLYTLFISARILNFLKGLHRGRQDAGSLMEVLESSRRRGGRIALGADLLLRLLGGEGLHAATPEGLKPLLRFRQALFLKVLGMAGYVQTVECVPIRLK
jgi:radical SAM superfamily enzyme YgiQ (UPF0313 family)